ncbi:hypothetical protein GCM10023169_02590 [Georgenia halophila]|uniref:Mycofactocin n=1 Tax=Georgenia halophila TaxID=620889 RepID=A0ABP8KUL7_9MICO
MSAGTQATEPLQDTRSHDGDPSPVAPSPADQSPVESDELIEEVSIDGMCGVY